MALHASRRRALLLDVCGSVALSQSLSAPSGSSRLAPPRADGGLRFALSPCCYSPRTIFAPPFVAPRPFSRRPAPVPIFSGAVVEAKTRWALPVLLGEVRLTRKSITLLDACEHRFHCGQYVCGERRTAYYPQSEHSTVQQCSTSAARQPRLCYTSEQRAVQCTPVAAPHVGRSLGGAGREGRGARRPREQPSE